MRQTLETPSVAIPTLGVFSFTSKTEEVENVKERMVIHCKSKEEWFDVESKVFRNGYLWSGYKKHRDWWSEDRCINITERALGHSGKTFYKEEGYTIISAADYLKEGEVEELKVGDRVECISIGIYKHIETGESYTVAETYRSGSDLLIRTVLGTPGVYAYRFKLAGNATKPKTTKENKTTSISDDEYFEKHKDELCESCKDLYDVNGSHPDSLCEGRFCDEMIDMHRHDNPNEEENNMNINSSIRTVFVKEGGADFALVEKLQTNFGNEIDENFTGLINLRINKELYTDEIKRLDDIEAKRLEKE